MALGKASLIEGGGLGKGKRLSASLGRYNTKEKGF